MQSKDFQLYEAAKMQASRFKKVAEDATRRVAIYEAWPEMEGLRAAKRGEVLDRKQSDAWRRGYEIGRRK